MIVLGVLFGIGADLIYAQRQKSMAYYKQGYTLYESKEYHKAIDYFKLAIQADYSNYIANYNLASTYAILTLNENSCNAEYYVKAINALKDCYALDSIKTKRNARRDHVFDSIRNEYEFNVLINGLDFKEAKFVRGFIAGKTFLTSIPGNTYYPVDSLTLIDNNTWTLSYHKNWKEMNDYWHGDQIGNPPELLIESIEGTWKLDGHDLILFDENRNVHKKITLHEPGRIGDLYYPDPNDFNGESETRHYWSCGKCGCGFMEGLFEK